jgi:hypothetical protein
MDIGTWTGIVQAIGAILVFFGLDAKRVVLFLRGRATMNPISPIRARIILALCVGSLVWSGFATFKITSHDEIPEFDEPVEGWKIGWSGNANGCQAAINGASFYKYADKYRLALGCFFLNSAIDEKDSSLYVGAPHDIVRGEMPLATTFQPPDQTMLFTQRRFVLLLIPQGINISQFHTPREARKLGVTIKLIGAQQFSL